jgi:hypothetical protein
MAELMEEVTIRRQPFEWGSSRFVPGLPSGKSQHGNNALRFICSLPHSAVSALFLTLHVARSG